MEVEDVRMESECRLSPVPEIGLFVLLNKKYENIFKNKGNSEGGVSFEDNGGFVASTGNGVVAKMQGVNKKILAIVLAVVMVLGLLPASVLLHAKAGSADQLDPVTMWVRVNGVDNWDEVSVNPGKISNNIGTVEVNNLPDGAEFVKAVIIDHDTGIETEIQSLGAIGKDYYYSLNEETNAGTLLDQSHEELILIYGNRYRVTDNQSGKGSYEIVAHEDEQGKYLWAKEDLVIQKIEPQINQDSVDDDYTIDSVSFRSGSSNGSVEVKNGSATIPYNKIKGDITVNVDFDKVESYTIKEGTVSQGGICQDQGAEKQAYLKNQEVNPVAAGETATFLLYSQSWTGGDKWIVNQLTLNGEDVNLPRTTTVGDYAQTTLKNGSVVTVTLVKDKDGLYWKEGDPRYHVFGIGGTIGDFDTWLKDRCQYEVTITNVHEDYVVDGNFKDSTKRELIVKGLTGIEKTAAAVEDIRLISGFSVMQRYYTFTSNSKNIYTANYTRPVFSESVYPSDNLILYTVKYGYNPYSVSTNISYDGTAPNDKGVRDSTAAGKPVDVIYNAKTADYEDDSTGRYDTSFRHWGQNTILTNKESSYRPSGQLAYQDLLLTTVAKDADNDWYAVALAQNAALDQQLYLNASPYNFRLQLNVVGDEFETADGINFADDRFSGDLNAYLEKDGHTVVDNAPYTYLPDTEPTKAGYAFEYWQLVDAEGKEIKETKALKTQYQKMDRLTLTEDLVNAVMGDVTQDDQTISLKAVWKEVKESSKTKVEIAEYTQVAPSTEDTTGNPVVTNSSNGKTYRRDYDQVETQNVGPIALLNLHKPSNSEYYVLNETLSNLKTDAVRQENDSEIPEKNLLALYYDYKTVTLDLQKVVKGKPKSTEYQITLKLIKNAESPVSVEEALAMMNLSASSEGVTANENSITIVKTYGKGTTMSFENVPYNWSYEVEEAESELGDSDFTAEYSHNGTLSDNTKLIVTNTGNNPGIEVDKKLTPNEDGTYDIDLAAYATGESYTEQLDANVPLDIAIVLDQSGSMATTDVYNYKYYDEGNTHKTSWTIDEAAGKYIKVGNKYYPVEQYSTTAYKKIRSSGDYLLSEMTAGLDLFSDYHTTDYYVPVNNNFYQLWVYQSGYTLASGHSDGRGFGGLSIGGYHVYFRYYDANGQVQKLLTYEGWDEADYTAQFTSAHPYQTSYRFGTDIYQKVTVYGLRYKDDNGNYVNLSLPSTTQWVDDKTINYVTDGATVFDTKTPVTFVDRSGRVNDGGQTLFVRNPITRVQALKQAVTEFVEQVGAQAKANNVDHRISVIGFAQHERPTWNNTLPASNIIGDSKFVTQNTGIFVDGKFKNYITPNTASINKVAVKELSGNSGYSNIVYFNNNGTAAYAYNDGWGKYETSSGKLTRNGSTKFTGNFYYPTITTLSESDYQQALTSVVQNDTDGNAVNDYIDSAINQINAFGGTYLPYGLAMANNVFKYNEAIDTQGNARKRIVLVFTDGEPGGTGFDQTIANESLVASSIAKDTYGASVYSVGLYPDSAKSEVTTFMHQLSSEYFTTTKDVYEEDGTVNASGTYYFNDEDGRTHSVTFKRNASGPKYILEDHGDRTIPVTYNEGGDHAQIIWSDSDLWLRSAKWNADDNRPNFYQFFTIEDAKQVSEESYYYSASDSDELTGVFEIISSKLQHPTTTVKLDAYSSFMQDGISENFDYSNATVELKTFDAKNTDVQTRLKVDAIKALKASQTSADGATYSWNDNYLNVSGFDYSKYYIGEDHDGKVLLATIKGLTLKEGVTGTHLPSNTTDSGVYKKDGNSAKLVADFPQQYADAQTFSADIHFDYVGEKKIEGQKFNVTFQLTKKDGATPYEGKIGDITFSKEGKFSSKMASGDVRTITGIPKDAILTVTVSDPDNTDTYYTYAITDTVNNGEDNIIQSIAKDDDSHVGEIRNIQENHPNVQITVTDTRQVLTVTNHTQGQPGEPDFSDRTQKFPITLTLLKDGTPVTGDVSFIDQSGEPITFQNGEYTAQLADTESVVLFVPEGYSVNVEDKGTFNYVPTYKLDGGDATTEPQTAVFNEASRSNGHAIDVYHTVNSVVISGILDGVKKINPVVYIAIAIVLVAAVWLYLLNKKKEEM